MPIDYTAADLDVIDVRVQRKLAQLGVEPAIRKGTLVSRDPSSTAGTATFDPSSLAVPVRIAASVACQAGDRVVIERWGSDWVVTATLARRPLEAWELTNFEWSTGGTTAVATFADMPESPQVTITKRHTDTLLVVDLQFTSYCTVTAASVEGGVFANGADYAVTELTFNTPTIGAHLHTGHRAKIAGVPAGEQVVVARWRRSGGTGTLNVDINDRLSLEVEERWAPS